VLDGPMTGAWFLGYVEQVLVPTLTPGGRDPGQPAGAQGLGCARGGPSGRSPAPVPPALQPQLQPNLKCGGFVALRVAKLEALLRKPRPHRG
jgi:hypothetical protein